MEAGRCSGHVHAGIIYLGIIYLQWFGGLGLQGAVHPEPQFAQYNLGGAFDRKRPPALVKMSFLLKMKKRG